MANIRLIAKVSKLAYIGEHEIDQKERKTGLEKLRPEITVQLPRNMVIQCALELNSGAVGKAHLEDYVEVTIADEIKRRVGVYPDSFEFEIVGTQVDPSDDLYTPLAGDTPSEIEEYWNGLKDIGYFFNFNIYKRTSENIIFPDAATKMAWTLREYLAKVNNQDTEIYLPQWVDRGNIIIFCGYCTEDFDLDDIDMGHMLLSLAIGEFRLTDRVDMDNLYNYPEKYIPERFWNFSSSDEDRPLEVDFTLDFEPVDLSGFYDD